MKELNKFRQFLNENEDDGYDKASRELFDMTWDEVRRENDPRMKQAVHDEVQKDDDTNYIDDVQESQSISQGFYEVDFIEMDGNEVTRDFRHFTDENEAKQMFNDLKSNPEIVKVTRNELFKGDGENYLGGSEEREFAVNKETDLHRIFLNSRLGDKRFEEPESIMQFFRRKNQAREEFLQNESVNEMKKPTIVVYDGKRLAVDPKDIERLKSGKDIVGKSTKNAGQEEWIPAKGKWKVEESVNEGMSKEALYSQIRDIIDSLDSGESDGIPLDNETEMLLQQELRRLRGIFKSMKESTSLEEIYNQVSEAKDFGFFGNEEGKTGNSIVSEAFDDYEMAVERAFQNLINKVNTAINIGGSGGTDTEVREMVMYHFDKIQDQITTTDLINSTFRK